MILIRVSNFCFCFLSQVDLLDPKGGKIMSSCYHPNEGKDSIGWCATCDPEAKKGQRGYCGPGETTREEEAPVMYPNSTNWGFCEPKCRHSKGDEHMIKARVYLSW